MPPRCCTSGRTPTHAVAPCAASAVGPPPTGHDPRHRVAIGVDARHRSGVETRNPHRPSRRDERARAASDGDGRRDLAAGRIDARDGRVERVRDPHRAEPDGQRRRPVADAGRREGLPAAELDLCDRGPVVVGHPHDAAAGRERTGPERQRQRPARALPRGVEPDERVARDVRDPERAAAPGERAGSSTSADRDALSDRSRGGIDTGQRLSRHAGRPDGAASDRDGRWARAADRNPVGGRAGLEVDPRHPSLARLGEPERAIRRPPSPPARSSSSTRDGAPEPESHEPARGRLRRSTRPCRRSRAATSCRRSRPRRDRRTGDRQAGQPRGHLRSHCGADRPVPFRRQRRDRGRGSSAGAPAARGPARARARRRAGVAPPGRRRAPRPDDPRDRGPA